MNPFLFNIELHKYSTLFAGNPNFQEQVFPYNDFTPMGMADPKLDLGEDRANTNPDGTKISPINKNKTLKRLMLLKKLKKKKEEQELKKLEETGDNPDAGDEIIGDAGMLEPHDFYSHMYGAQQGIEGLNSVPLEFYSGSIMDESGAITNNPYNNIYQSASFYCDLAHKLASDQD